jgi:hypothetical protein
MGHARVRVRDAAEWGSARLGLVFPTLIFPQRQVLSDDKTSCVTVTLGTVERLDQSHLLTAGVVQVIHKGSGHFYV